MSKKKSLKQKQRMAPERSKRHRRRLTIVVSLVLGLSIASGILAQWRATRITKRINALLAPTPTVPGPGSPSKEYIYAGGRLLATEEPASGTAPAAPTSLLAAIATQPTQVNLSWNAPSGSVDHYQVERSQSGSNFTILAGSPTTTNFSDTTASSGMAYLYRVCAVDAVGNHSAYSNIDLTTTILFTDDPLVAGVTTIKAQHLLELHQAVNALRATAGLGAATWTDSSPAGVMIKAAHIQELRTNLDQALSALGLTTAPYTDPTLSTAINIKRDHIAELRQRLK